ncbi:SAM hydrolase/SAM-dependent halogenase family protein [Thiohalorhabdus sp. Cl-TMA]|uniref:S-adenosyl-l-methionine hydroxide adenosyltransferase family protein n=1 Tax=Thiohalorhabdus methylotrophus TaxID=3242694 RepID=A0ABV4TSS0_9GAMM
MAQPVITLFTDFGITDPYVGQMHARIMADAPQARVIDLHHYAPAFNPGQAGLLLEALLPYLAPRMVVVGVVDPGVGTSREALVVETPEHWFVGPDNGLFAPLLERQGVRCYRMHAPGQGVLSASFHGRDLFAPVAAALSRGDRMVLDGLVDQPVRVESRREEVLYVDHYGNLMTGLPVPAEGGRLRIEGRTVDFARTFGEVGPGELFWYRNSLDRVEIAAREGSAAKRLGAGTGTPVSWVSD